MASSARSRLVILRSRSSPDSSTRRRRSSAAARTSSAGAGGARGPVTLVMAALRRPRLWALKFLRRKPHAQAGDSSARAMAQTRGDARVSCQAHVCTRCRRAVPADAVFPRTRGAPLPHGLGFTAPRGRRAATPVVSSSRLEAAPGGGAGPRRRQLVSAVTDVAAALRACEALCVSAALALLVRVAVCCTRRLEAALALALFVCAFSCFLDALLLSSSHALRPVALLSTRRPHKPACTSSQPMLRGQRAAADTWRDGRLRSSGGPRTPRRWLCRLAAPTCCLHPGERCVTRPRRRC